MLMIFDGGRTLWILLLFYGKLFERKRFDNVIPDIIFFYNGTVNLEDQILNYNVFT